MQCFAIDGQLVVSYAIVAAWYVVYRVYFTLNGSTLMRSSLKSSAIWDVRVDSTSH